MLTRSRLPMSLLLVLSFQLLCTGPGRAETENDNGYLSPPELYKLMEESEQTYRLNALEALGDLRAEDFASIYWPSSGNGLAFPWIAVQENGSRSLLNYDLGEGCEAILRKAEPHFDAERYEKARNFYIKAKDKFPKCYLAYSSLGDTYHFEGNSLEALSWYKKSIEINPYDFRGHFYKANTLYNLARFDEARAAYLVALAMKPHRESMTGVIQDRVTSLGEKFVDRPFIPRALARQEKDYIGIYASPDTPYWITYGMCKAVWIGEPAHREARNGNTEHVWSLLEERQCLFSMLETYYSLREEGELEPDPELERILAAAENDLLNGFIFYEIAYQINGDLMILYPDKVMDEVLKYISHYVLPPRP